MLWFRKSFITCILKQEAFAYRVLSKADKSYSPVRGLNHNFWQHSLINICIEFILFFKQSTNLCYLLLVNKISKSALARHKNTFKASGAKSYEYSPKNNTNKVFSKEQENMMVEYLKPVVYIHYGLVILDLCKPAYDFAKENNIKYLLKWDDEKLVGEGWTRLFRQCHSFKPEVICF